jgi:uncharacterized CHY-type Zn-finger protein
LYDKASRPAIFFSCRLHALLALRILNPLNKQVLVEIQVQCPHCGELITTTADTSQGDYATIEDCEVCCSPMNIEIACEPGRVEEVRVTLA